MRGPAPDTAPPRSGWPGPRALRSGLPATAETAKRVAELPATAEALRSGALSLSQAAAVSEAAVAAPGTEAELLELARSETVKTLQERARRVVLDSRGSVEERYERQRKLRSFSTWTDEEGMTAGRFRLTPDAGAALVNRIRAEADRHYRKAHKEGRQESPENYAADALVGLVTGHGFVGDPTKSKGTEVVVLVSRESLRRGTVDPAAGEVCEVPGFGAIPVSRARELLADAFLKGVLVDGKRVMCGFDNREKEAGRVVETPDGRWVRLGEGRDRSPP